ncbi:MULTISPECIES: YutD-like domain-containing protein [unclassified Brevibacillus]|uniref:YutD family protein n=1 Tax=unclassified Brevibacillus TaxID=2684853 RepID=UPI0020121D25|nr:MULTISPECIES: YutD-like domain-containing protein [unclassified Brevibacillus]
MIRTPAGTYEVMEENRDGWNPEAFKERYSDILDKYDYIVGDWGYGQLRLRGFYDNSNRKVPFEQRIAALDEYLHEFCNFGCPYFVLKKVKPASPDQHGQEAADGAEGTDTEQRKESDRDEPSLYIERKERRRFHPRHGRQERTERSGSSGERSGRHERGDNKSKLAKGEKGGRDSGKERRQHAPRANRERDKITAGPTPPKRES